MRVFAVGDFHQSEALKEAVIEEANTGDYDLVILTGDYEEESYYESLYTSIDPQVIAVTGNWDFGFRPPENGAYEMLFNYKKISFRDYKIVVMGSVYPDTFREEVIEFFEDTPKDKRIIATHYPPHMLGDLARTGTRAGFPEFRDLLLRTRPALWLCGHIHEDYGEFSLMQTTVLNCAARESGKGWAIELADGGVEHADEVELVDPSKIQG